MRSFILATTGLLLVTALQAQQPTQPIQVPQPAAAAPGGPTRLDHLLDRWEKEMQGVKSLSADIIRTSVDKTFDKTEAFSGTAKFVKPNLVLLDLRLPTNPQVFERYLCTGTFLYQYQAGTKTIHVHELPPPQPGQPGGADNFLSYIFPLKAAEAKTRYQLKLVKEDQWYVYLEMVPIHAEDKRNFQRARLVLNQTTFLPRQVWWEEPNGNEVTWDLPKVQRDVNIDRLEFAPPQQAPQGWNMVRVPRAESVPNNAQAQPTKVRQNDQ